MRAHAGPIAIAMVLVTAGIVVASRSMRVLAYGPPDAAAEEAFLEHLSSYPNDRDVLDHSMYGELSVGDYIEAHGATDEFYLGDVTENLEDEIVPVDEWMAPLVYEGEEIGAVAVMGGDGLWTVGDLRGEEFAEKLLDLGQSDRLLVHPPWEWYVVDGEDVRALSEEADLVVPEPITLSEFQQLMIDRYEQLRNWPDQPALGGGGRPVSVAGEGSARGVPPWALAAAVALGVGVAVVATLRRARASRSAS